MNYKELIQKKINQSTGIKAVDLVLDIMSEVNPQLFKLEEYTEVLNELVRNGLIIELEYVLLDMDYRTKSLFFPIRTTFHFVKN